MSEKDVTVIPIHRPNRLEVTTFFAQGLLMSIPMAIYFEGFFANHITQIAPFLPLPEVMAILLAPFIEEFAKVFPLFARHGETARTIVLLGFITGLGFGFAEFLIYVFQYGAPVGERILQIFDHASYTLISSYGLVSRRFIPFFLLAVAFHASFNLLVEQGFLVVVAVASAGIAILLAWNLYNRAKDTLVD
jgi:RsiW-degrading membrane proteinase PrsW (M82 family)